MKKILRIVFVVIAIVATFLLAFILGRPAIRTATSTVVKTVVPWSDRAELHLKQHLLTGESGQNVAATIQGISHPTGKSPKLGSVQILHVGEALNVRIDVNWKGGLLGTDYTTVLVWEFSKNAHTKASITQDSAPTSVSLENQKKLDEYFRTECFAKLKSNLGD